MPPYRFEVEIRDFEPLSGKVKRVANKKDLADRIIRKAKDETTIARREFAKIPVRIEVWFYLWKGGKGFSNTTSKKDLDNLLKLVFDALQPHVDSQHTTSGAGIIETDDNIFQVTATKQIVPERLQAGMSLVISAF
jgi:Holliday junction resolvase RusA-like endonuclease